MESQKRIILLIEDDAVIAELLRELLEESGYIVVCASQGQEALQILRSQAELPHLILLDLMMPVMDGMQFRKEQISDVKLKKIPVIIMSAGSNLEQKMKETAAVAYLKKPINIETILSTVDRQFTFSHTPTDIKSQRNK